MNCDPLRVPMILPSAAAMLCACATMAPEPDHPVWCPVTVQFENRSSNLLRLSLDGNPVPSVSRVGERRSYSMPYPSSSEAGCRRSSVEITARPVQPGGAPGWFIPVVSPEGGVFEYHQRAPIRIMPHRVAQAMPLFGVRMIQTRYDAVVSAYIDDATTAEPVNTTEFELLLRRVARLELEAARSQREIAGYQASLRELSERLVAEQAARTSAEHELDTMRSLLAQAQRDNLQLEDTLRRELEQGRLSTSSMNWVIHNASQAVVEHKESVCGAMLSTGVNAALDVVEFGANISLLAKIAIKGARRFVGRLAAPYFDELVNRMCA
jgi:hypothetical protein